MVYWCRLTFVHPAPTRMATSALSSPSSLPSLHRSIPGFDRPSFLFSSSMKELCTSQPSNQIEKLIVNPLNLVSHPGMGWTTGRLVWSWICCVAVRVVFLCMPLRPPSSWTKNWCHPSDNTLLLPIPWRIRVTRELWKEFTGD